jgi:hypothetical protein
MGPSFPSLPPLTRLPHTVTYRRYNRRYRGLETRVPGHDLWQFWGHVNTRW